MLDPLVQHVPDAEAALLGGALLSAEALDVLVSELDPMDFYSPAHQLIAMVMRAMWQGGDPVDAVTVATELTQQGKMDAVGGPGYLLQLQAGVPAIGNASRYARLISEAATLRYLQRVGLEIADMAARGGDAIGIVDQAKLLVADVEVPTGSGMPSPSVDMLLNSPEPEFDWLVPGLLERLDRVMVTAGEGGGKSSLLDQFAVCLAAGVHPFTFAKLPRPLRVLKVDVENSSRQVRRRLARMVAMAERFPGWDPNNLLVEIPGDLDLLGRHDSRWLLERVATVRPDVLITGPLYKLHADDPNTEPPARKLAALFDQLRHRFGVTLILEAHSAKAQGSAKRSLVPIGATLWQRWCEFGMGIRCDHEMEGRPLMEDERRMATLERWKSRDDERQWPYRLQGAQDLAREWPWIDAHYEPDRWVSDSARDEYEYAEGW